MGGNHTRIRVFEGHLRIMSVTPVCRRSLLLFFNLKSENSQGILPGLPGRSKLSSGKR